MNILIDMNLSPKWAAVLETAGFSAIHWSSVGDPRASDFKILQWAAENRFVVFTNDLDFGALLAHSKALLPSVFQLRTANLNPEKIGTRVISLLHRFETQLNEGSFVSVNDLNERVRILPLK